MADRLPNYGGFSTPTGIKKDSGLTRVERDEVTTQQPKKPTTGRTPGYA